MKNCKMKENQLINNLSYDNLDLEGVRKLYMQLEKEEIIKQYTLPKKAGIFQPRQRKTAEPPFPQNQSRI